MFTVEQMLAQARAETGLADFGHGDFREGLEELVDSTNRDMKLSAIGEIAFAAEVQRLLVNRLRFVEDLKRHPEILDDPLDDPLIILGLPRTGTTKLQRLIAADPEMQSLKFWQTMNPARMPNAEPGKLDPRIEIARQMIAMIAQVAPGLMQSHPLEAEFPEEECFLMAPTFRSHTNYMGHPAPGYAEWIASQSLHDTYGYLKQQLQYLQWQDGGRRERRWILKTPLHLGNLDLTAELFPRATYVCLHRDLNEVLPSFCRLMEMFWRMRSDEVDMHSIGNYVAGFWAGEMQRHLEQRDMLAGRLDILDIHYEEVRDDAFGVVRGIYRHVGRELTPACEQRMRDWDAHDQHGSFGSYRYTLEQYGLEPAAIATAFEPYAKRFLR